jgi:hypothetical protein
MGNVTSSGQNNITSPNGNSLAVFVDGVTQEMKVKDVMGNIQPITDFIPTTPIYFGNYGLYAQTTNSVPITATTVESSLISSGVGTLSVPANAFQVGDSFNGFLDGQMSALGSAEIQIKVKTLLGVILIDSGIIDLDVTTSKAWILNLQFTIRTLGTSGVASISSGGIFSYVKNGSTNFDGFVFNSLNNTTFDTTISNTLVITAQWNTNSGSNSIFSTNFVLNKVF